MMTQWVSKEAPFTLPEISEATSASTRDPSDTGFPTLTLVMVPVTSMRRSPSIMVASPFLGALVINCLLLLLKSNSLLLPRFPRRVVAPHSCIVESSEVQRMSQMHYFCLLEGMLGPREPESSLPLYSPSCREGSFSETHIHTLACLCGIGAYASGLVHQACSPGFLVGLFSEAGCTAQFSSPATTIGPGSLGALAVRWAPTTTLLPA